MRSIPLVSFWLEPLRAAVGFLTVLPIGRSISPDQPSGQRAVSNSRAFFPFVGLLLGLVLVVVGFAAALIFPVYLTAGILLVVMVLATRGLHLDGLMDVCDGLFGGYTKERRLEIMKDPHVGAFGVVAGSMLILLKFAALLSLLDPRFIIGGSWAGYSDIAIGGGWAGYSDLAALMAVAFDAQPGKVLELLLFPTLSRWAMVVCLGAFPYVRQQGLGSPFHQGNAKIATLAAALTALAASLVLGGFGGLGLFAGVTLLALAAGWIMTRALGGLTGDCYGAVNEISEVAVLTGAVALAHQDWLDLMGFLP